MTTIAFNPGISNADVSRRTGLAPQTASAIVAELEQDGLLTRGEVLRGRRGQPATPLFLKLDAAYSIGCDVGWQHIDMVLVDLSAQPIARYRRDFAYVDGASIVDELVSGIGSLLEKLAPAQRERLIGIGIASPTNISRNIDALDAPPGQVELWKALDMTAEVERALGISTMWFNDGNAACWAELVMMAQPRPASFAYLHIGTFLAAGLVAEHSLWEGPTGNSANLGSMLVCKLDGTRDFGHLIASIRALEISLATVGISLPRTDPLEWPWSDWEPQVGPWLTRTAGALAQIILNTAAVFEFDLAVIDSVMPRPLLERLLVETQVALDQLPVMTFDRPRLTLGRLGHDATPLGAAFMPIFRRYFSRDLRDMASWELAPIHQ